MEPPIAGPRLPIVTPVFEGPLELLLALAEREEVDIFQVSLARITDAYLTEIAQREVPDPHEMAEFLWMAARLLLLKSIRLLPASSPPTRKRSCSDGRRTCASVSRSTARPVEAGGQEEPLDVDMLVAAFNSVLARIPPRPVVITGRTWTLEEKLEAITKRLLQGPIELLGLILESEDRLEAVVTFVAVLELVRRSAITVRQKERFGPIHIEARAA